MKILIASDHGGFELKQYLTKKIPLDFEDLGPRDSTRVDYPDYAQKLIEKMSINDSKEEPTQFGILICGSGQGMAMKANRYEGIRAALCWDEESTRLSREHNNANILCLGGRLLSFELTKKLVEIFLNTKFEGGRHTARVQKISR